MAADIARIVTLGASNLTCGFPAVLSAARAAWGPQVEVFAALGLGRSYGAPSRVVVRVLPSILDSGLWRVLESLPKIPTRALVADVGNDIMYGFSPGMIMTWIEEALVRLQSVTQDIILTDLPLANIRRLSKAKFLVFRSILFPSCRLSLGELLEAAERVNTGLEELSAAHGVRLFKLDPTWYGLDPIHIHPRLWQSAWQDILGAHFAASGGNSLLEGLRLYLMPPERRWVFGVEQFTAQLGVALSSGGRVWLY
jgi:hypothetical protein